MAELCGARKGVTLSSMHPVIVADCTLPAGHEDDHHDQVEDIRWKQAARSGDAHE
jgi:hypothetical protein